MLTSTILSYYVLRDDMLGYYVNDIAERLATRGEADGWQVNHLGSFFRFVSGQLKMILRK